MDAPAIARARMRAQGVWASDARDVHAALRHLVAVQAQEFPYARWSLAQRSGDPQSSIVQRAFDDGAILRTHVLRPTWHFVAPEDLRWLMRLSGPRVTAGSARRCAELGLDPKTLAKSNDVIARAVADMPRTRRALAVILDAKGLNADAHRIVYMLMRAELDMVVCSGPLEGKQHTYAPFDGRVPPAPEISRDEMLGKLARGYFGSRGPATVRDFAWWSGMPMADVRRAVDVAGRPLTRREIDGRTYLSVGQPRTTRAPKPRIDLVQVYDEIIISYSESRDVLRTESASFRVPMNIGGFAHVILRDGRLLGHWRAQRARDEVRVETRVAGELDEATRAALSQAVQRYTRFASS